MNFYTLSAAGQVSSFVSGQKLEKSFSLVGKWQQHLPLFPPLHPILLILFPPEPWRRSSEPIGFIFFFFKSPSNRVNPITAIQKDRILNEIV
jgi:hypothetical protein